MTKVLALLVAVSLVSLPAQAGKKEQDRLRKCGEVLKEILDIPDNVPQDLLDKAECVLILPSVKKFAIGFGGSYGRGAMSCRTGKNFTGRWSPPAMVQLKGGNIGFQLGGQATDFLLLVMNTKGADSILRSKVKLGVDAAAAAGPKGRTATAATDALLRAEILSYSRARGLFSRGFPGRVDPAAGQQGQQEGLRSQDHGAGDCPPGSRRRAGRWAAYGLAPQSGLAQESLRSVNSGCRSRGEHRRVESSPLLLNGPGDLNCLMGQGI